MTQDELADAAELSRNTIGMFERGQRAPNVDELRKIAETVAQYEFEIDDHLRIEFTKNGRPKLEPVIQQMTFRFDEGEAVSLRIECASEGLTIKKVKA